jgi:hypothetical protein
MAKATPQAYQVVGSPLAYNGKVAQAGDVLGDIPGESISWLLADGHIVATDEDVTGVSAPKATMPAPRMIRGIQWTPPTTPQPAPTPEPTPEPEPAPAEPEAGA